VRKRKVTYPPPKTATKGARNGGLPRDGRESRPTVATIDLAALARRNDLSVGDRVRIGGAGLYAGELATVEELTIGVIPAAAVRTAEGRTRRVRVVDLEPVPHER
jgi:hypothetical protein